MKISIIVPVYNVEKFLPRCLDSLIGQTFNDYEIIIIDDGSTDGSPKIISNYIKKSSRKIIYIRKKNEGQASARNIGIEQASGEYLMFVDSDDYIDIDTLQIVYNHAKEKNADIVCFNSYKEENNHIKEYTREFKYVIDCKKRYIITQSCPWGMLIKTQLIKLNKLYFPKLRAYEDVAIVPSYVMHANRIEYIDNKLYYYCIRNGSTMNQISYSEKFEDIFDAMNNLYELFKKNNMIKQYHDEIEFLFIKHLLHGAGLRFIKFDNYSKNLKKIIKIMNLLFKKWNKNKYFKKESIKYKIMCELLYKEKIDLIKKLKKR